MTAADATTSAAGKEPGTLQSMDESANRRIHRFHHHDGTLSYVSEGWLQENLQPLRLLAEARTWAEVAELRLPRWLEERALDAALELAVNSVTPFHPSQLGLDPAELWAESAPPRGLEGLTAEECADVATLLPEGQVVDRDLLAELSAVIDLLAVR